MTYMTLKDLGSKLAAERRPRRNLARQWKTNIEERKALRCIDVLPWFENNLPPPNPQPSRWLPAATWRRANALMNERSARAYDHDHYGSYEEQAQHEAAMADEAGEQ